LSIGGYQEEHVFSPDETAMLVRLGAKYPTSLEAILLLLAHVGDASAGRFMINSYQHSDVGQLWILQYFSRVPVESARTLLTQEMTSGADASRRTLAATALVRIGQDDAFNIIEANVFSAYWWVRNRVKDLLTERLRSETSRRKQKMFTALLRSLLKKKGI
jgi:hypothetical protein